MPCSSTCQWGSLALFKINYFYWNKLTSIVRPFLYFWILTHFDIIFYLERTGDASDSDSTNSDNFDRDKELEGDTPDESAEKKCK